MSPGDRHGLGACPGSEQPGLPGFSSSPVASDGKEVRMVQIEDGEGGEAVSPQSGKGGFWSPKAPKLKVLLLPFICCVTLGNLFKLSVL